MQKCRSNRCFLGVEHEQAVHNSSVQDSSQRGITVTVP